jgi:hypothetical protein
VRIPAAALGLVIAALVAVGCGETVIDDAKTEGALQHNLEQSLGEKVTRVECPSDVEVKTGAKFECTVVLAGNKEETATLKILNEDADVELIDLSPGK